MNHPTPLRFILIDDSEADNLFHQIMIRKAGFTGEILVFENGSEALEFLQHDAKTEPTCILLDINMPVINGFELAVRAAHLLEGKPAMVVVMLTSSQSPHDRERMQQIDVIRGYVTKPLTVAGVSQLLHPS